MDPHSFYADPDPAVFLNADPYPAAFYKADSDPACKFFFLDDLTYKEFSVAEKTELLKSKKKPIKLVQDSKLLKHFNKITVI